MNKVRKVTHPDTKSVDKYSENPTWRIFEIISEFVTGHTSLAHVRPAISIFGSARFEADNPYYNDAKIIAKLLSDLGFTIITGGGPGIMDAANHGASLGKSLSVGLNISLPFEQQSNGKQDILLSNKVMVSRIFRFSIVFSSPEKRCSLITHVHMLLCQEVLEPWMNCLRY